MRTLAKTPKVKQQQQPQGEVEKKENKQQPSKKLTKTVFHTPFRYKMYCLLYSVKHSISKIVKQLLICSSITLSH